MRLFVIADSGGQPDPAVTATIVGPWVTFPFPFRNRDRWVTCARDATSAPAGTFDLGDPLDPVWQDTALTRQQSRALESEMGEARDAWLGLSRREVLVLLLDHPSGARCFQARFLPGQRQARALTADDWLPMFDQTPWKPVL